MISPLMIPSFVENSVLYDFNRMPNYDKRINILAVISGDRLKVIIKDNELGIAIENQSKTGLGIEITKERITLPERNAQIQIKSRIDEDYHGATIKIEIPLKIKKD